MKCFLSNFLRYCLLIYTIVATGGTIRTRTTMTSTTNTKTTIMTIETSPMDSNNCQANVECCYYQEEALQQQQQQQQQLSGKKDIKLTKREIDERLQQPFTIMQSIEEEMEPEEEEQVDKYEVEEEANKNDHNYDDDDDDDNEEEEYSLDYEDDENDDNEEEEEEEEENLKANKNRIRRRRRRKRKKRKRKNGNKNPKRKRKRRKHQHVTVSPLGQPANLLLASLTQLPTAHPPLSHIYKPHKIIKHKRKRTGTATTTTTMKPKLKPLKYILNKGNLIKKKKQEYLSHLGYVFLPFIKFVAFFTVLNPFTLAVFFFMLISPVVFGLLGFTALSFILRPAMNLLFAVKHRIGNINRHHRRYRHKQQHKHNHIAPRPITIHKHYYPQQPRPNVHPPLFLRRPTRPLLYQPHRHPHPYPHPHRADYDKDISFHNSTEVNGEVVVNGLVNVQQPHQNFNPLLPQVRQQLKHIEPPVGLSTRFILPSL